MTPGTNMRTDSHTPFRLCVLGLGAVGQRMLEQSALHADFEAIAGFDPSPQARAQAVAMCPELVAHDSADAALDHPGVDAVYVAAPPLAHADLVRRCLARRLPVLCEKPLGVDIADSQALTEAMNASGLAQAVNFVFASAPAVTALQQQLADPGFGLQHIFIRLHFHQWPRPFQAHAAWLSGAAQGGFTREVSSHFVYLLQRTVGAVRLVQAQVQQPSADAAETQVSALLQAGQTPVTLLATTGGQPQEVVEARYIGQHRELLLRNWYGLWQVDAVHPQGVALINSPDPRRDTYQAQLGQWAAQLRGQPHSLPDFASALQVQTVIETMLRAGASR